MTSPFLGPRPFLGQRIVGAAFLVAVFGWGVGFYGPPVFLKAVQEARGWPIGLVSAAVTAHFLVGALVVARLPGLYARFGLARVTLAGAALLGLGCAGWALAREPWQLFLATVPSGLGWVAMGATAVNAIIAPWFVRKRPGALSMAYNGASLGGVIFSPLWVALIGALGFPLATALVGLAMLGTVGFLAARFLRHTPESLGQWVDGEPPAPADAPGAIAERAPVANLWRDRAFLTLAGGSALALFAQIGLIAHLFSLLVPALGASGAGIAAGGATAAAVLGRQLVAGLMPAGADRRSVLALSHGVQVLGCGAMLLAGGQSLPWLLLGVALIGLGIGNATSLPPLIAQQEFARGQTSAVVARSVGIAQAAYAFAPAGFGLLREGAASPGLFALAASVMSLAILTFLAGRGAADGRGRGAADGRDRGAADGRDRGATDAPGQGAANSRG